MQRPKSIAQNLKVNDSQAKKIDEFSKAESTERLKSKWQAATGQSFDDLPKNEATTVIASVAFQYGSLESERLTSGVKLLPETGILP